MLPLPSPLPVWVAVLLVRPAGVIASHFPCLQLHGEWGCQWHVNGVVVPGPLHPGCKKRTLHETGSWPYGRRSLWGGMLPTDRGS